ncbi:MAG TPA: peptide-methionine (S)-S-oxide reductase [Gemmatimonadales bacterium]|nr:peptide-methionine (S)-S-oxide reductase [Gemmatimonadales bacterium]
MPGVSRVPGRTPRRRPRRHRPLSGAGRGRGERARAAAHRGVRHRRCALLECRGTRYRRQRCLPEEPRLHPGRPRGRRDRERVKARVEASGKWKRPITTSIEPASAWYRAEEYHQDYLRKNPGGYSCHFLRE